MLEGDYSLPRGVPQPFAYGDDAAAALGDFARDVGQESLRIEDSLGQVDEMRRVAWLLPRQGSGGGDPAGVPAHGLDDLHRVDRVEGGGIASCVSSGERVEASDAAVAGAVIRVGEVVVDGLRDADDAHLPPGLRGEASDLMGGVGRVIAADVEPVADVVGLENGDEALVIRFRQLLAAGAESGRRGVGKE